MIDYMELAAAANLVIDALADKGCQVDVVEPHTHGDLGVALYGGGEIILGVMTPTGVPLSIGMNVTP